MEELIKESEWLRVWLQFQLELDSNAVEAVLDCPLDLGILLRESKPALSLLCDREAMQAALSTCASPARQFAGQAICTLSLAQDRMLTDAALKTLAIKKIANNVSTKQPKVNNWIVLGNKQSCLLKVQQFVAYFIARVCVQLKHCIVSPLII